VDDLSHDRGRKLLVNELCFSEEDTVEQVNKYCGTHVSFTTLKQCYEELFNRCNQLVEPDTKEEHTEQAIVRTACVKAFLLLLLGYSLFCRQEQLNR